MHHTIPYTDIALQFPGAIDADPLIAFADGAQAMIYWPGGSRNMPEVRVAGIGTGSTDEVVQAEMATIAKLPNAILHARVGGAALRRWAKRVETLGIGDPESFLDEAVTAAAQELCAQEGLPLGFVTLANVTKMGRPARYASLSFVAGNFHPRSVLQCIQTALRAGKSTSN